MTEQITYLIIGNGIAGVTAAEILREEAPDATIGVIADDPFPVYYRPALKDYLGGRIREDKLWARPTSFYQDHNILFLPERVVGIQPAQHCVQLRSKRQVSYSKLLLATGAQPTRLRCPNNDLNGVVTLRTVADYQAVLQRLDTIKRVVVTGSGTLALETIETLRHRGLQVTHLVRRRTLWSDVLDAVASDLVLQQEMRDGVDVRLEEEIAEITGARGEVSGVVTTRGAQIACEMVLAAIGIEPEIGFIRASGIACGRGVKVDNKMLTNVPDIYAAGDLLETTDTGTGRARLIGQWYPTIVQARTASYSMLNLLDNERPFRSSTFYNATFLYGLDFASVGLTNVPGCQEIVAEPKPRTYRKLLLKDGIPVGLLALGDRRQALAFKRAIDHRVSLLPVTANIFADDFKLDDWLDSQSVPPPLLGVTRAGDTFVRKVIHTENTEKTVEANMINSQSLSEALLVQIADPTLQLRLPEMALSQNKVITIGRQAGVHLLIDEGTISRYHAEISYANGQYLLRDLGSTNGTFVNEEPLEPSEPCTLKANDQLRFGNVVKFRFLLRSLPSEAARQQGINAPISAVGITNQYDIEPSREQARSGQPVLNPDGSLMPPGAGSAVPAAVVATLKEAPALIVLPDVKAAENTSPPQVYLLKQGKRTTIGREVGNDIALTDVVVSRRHAEVFLGPDGVYIRDLGSSNGVKVNQTKIDNPYRLAHGDRIVMGSTMIIFVDLQTGQEPTDKLRSTSRQQDGEQTMLQVSQERAALQGARGMPGGQKALAATVRLQSGEHQVEMKVCRKCGIANTPIARFCAGCSAPLGT